MDFFFSFFKGNKSCHHATMSSDGMQLLKYAGEGNTDGVKKLLLTDTPFKTNLVFYC